MSDKIMDVLERMSWSLCMLCTDPSIKMHDEEVISKAHSQIIAIFKEMLPREREHIFTNCLEIRKEGTACLCGSDEYNQAIQDIRAKIEELKG